MRSENGYYIVLDLYKQTITAQMVTLHIDHGLGTYMLKHGYNYMILPNVTVESIPSIIKKYKEE